MALQPQFSYVTSITEGWLLAIIFVLTISQIKWQQGQLTQGQLEIGDKPDNEARFNATSGIGRALRLRGGEDAERTREVTGAYTSDLLSA